MRRTPTTIIYPYTTRFRSPTARASPSACGGDDRAPRARSMTARRYVLALDQGTTGSTALVVDPDGRVLARGYAELPQYFPRPGWGEHDPEETWSSPAVCCSPPRP